jgi:opacity protein-like surface antigen
MTMRRSVTRFAWLAAALPLGGCGWLPDAYTGCADARPYQSARQMEPLRVPSGADLPDTRNALRIPELKTPELPLGPGSCLEHPPDFGAASLAGGAAASPAAATAGAGPAEASRPRELDMDDGSPWQGRMGAGYQPTTNTDFDGGSEVEFNSNTGFLVGLGYEVTEHLEVGANFTYEERDYEASLAGDSPGETFQVEGDLESMGVMFDLSYYFLTGRFRPFLSAGVGWNFVDTNIPTTPPQVGCWWNPWFGYICEDFQETKNVDGLAYQAGAGVRYQINPAVSLSGSYRMNWVDFPKADGTPTFDAIQLILNWGF